jgi:putative nucleotidyltransferase-like protein
LSSTGTVRRPDREPPEPIELAPGEFEQRVKWARAHGHPHYLWPGVPPDDWRAVLVEIERVTRLLLLDTPARLSSDHDAFLRALGAAAFTSGMGPLLGLWVERGILDAADRVRDFLSLQLSHGRARAERMQRTLRHAVGVLDDAHVSVTVLKGAHTAYVYFPEPGARPMADLDLLIEPASVPRAEAALAAAGYTYVAGSRLARPYRSAWQPPGEPVSVRSVTIHHRDNPYTVDLHAALEVSFFGVRTIDFGETASRLVAADWAGPRVSGLAQPLLAAYHAAKASQGFYNLTLIRIVEFARMLRHDAKQGLDWDELSDLVKGARAERFVYPAFELAECLLPGTVEPGLRETLVRAATRALRASVEASTPSTAQRLDRMNIQESFMWARTPSERLRRAIFMLLPLADSGSLRKLGGIYLERLFRVLRRRVRIRSNTTEGR